MRFSIKPAIAAALTLTFVLPVAAQEQASIYPTEVTVEKVDGAKPRNVIFILSDDHRYDAMSFMGHQFIETPVLDSMAKNGVHLKNAFVTTSLCSPSRASILTGLYTHKHRVIDNNRSVPEGTLFFPQFLQKAGYETAYFGKWHMGGESDDPRPGFDEWVSFKGQGNYLAPGPKYTINVNGERVPQKGYITDELTDYAVDWIKERPKDKPYFVYLSHKAVHANFTPADRHNGKYEDVKVEEPVTQANSDENNEGKPRWLRDQRNSWHGVDFPYHSALDVKQYYKRYCETFLAVDESIGRVMEALKERGELDSTLIVYMGDNGFMFGEHGLIDKRVAYETSIRVPMVMQCPELFNGGTVVDQVVANIDIAPTIFEAAGVKKPAYMDGASFIPLAQGKEVPWRDYFLYVYYWEKNFPQSPTVFCLRGNQYKLMHYYGLWDSDELYDIQADPNERKNLIYDASLAKVKREMEKELYKKLGDAGGMYIPLNQPRGNSQNKRLRERGGDKAADFPKAMVLDDPANKRAK